LRIGLAPCSVAMLTCRSLISRVDILYFLLKKVFGVRAGATAR
jgi:hypothetical protein